MDFFIFIRCKPGRTSAVGVAMAKVQLPQVREIYSISGKWDLMVRVQGEAREDFEASIIESLLSGQWQDIKRTETVIGYRTFDPEDAYVED
ncbi:MAG: Lrp/AsnC family transcriptional regulator [Alphaproteobacteria bacterium]|nr:Lrp/AsnC family transcriptional regulator [Alphaproteobacteria bacterium]MDB5722001.1 Lrp/AsnC family transcriptional regulator [Alphaproteobacteria bacterium]